MSATDAFTPALNRTKAQLFKPFRWATWARVALLGLATGEFGSGGCNFNGGGGSHPSQQNTESFASMPQWWHSIPMGAIVAIAVLVFLLVIVMLYVHSIGRFMLFETVLTGRASLREQWSKWQRQGRNYFAFQLLLTAAVVGLLLVCVGLPLLAAKNAGMFDVPREHLAALILGGMMLVLVAIVIALSATIVQVMAKDFVVPQMALENLDFVEAWRRYWAMLGSEKGGYAGYLGLKAIMRLAAVFAFTIISFIIMFVLLLPFIIVFAVAIGFSGLAGLVWTPFTIALVAVAGTIAISLLVFAFAFVSSPVTIFFPSYALHFFGSRYRPLYEAMFPPPAAPPSATPPETPPEPPPILPEPAGI